MSCQECDRLRAQVEALETRLKVERDARHDADRVADRRSPALPDLNLLRKLADGVGGRRTGDLAQRGWLTWKVTPAGRRALKESGK